MESKFFKKEELAGKLVIDQEALIVGKFEDLAVTEDGKVGLLVKEEGGEERLIMLDDIKKIEDVILLKAEGKVKPREAEPEAEPEEEPSEAEGGNICPNCGWENKENTRFCVKCGTELG
jgi:sporulation protein YlmC with PRC-barrel domain